jgi:hypothetical protein
MKNATILSNLLIGVIILVMICLVARFFSTRKDVTARLSPCEMNLRTIELAKIEWADNQINVDTNHAPTWDDLRPYFHASWSNKIPVCPDGGTYTIGRLDKPPTCSIGGLGHSLSQ